MNIIPKLNLYKLDPDCEWNKESPLEGFFTEYFYLILGEVEDSGHYVFMEYPSGKIVATMLDLDRFIPCVPDDYSFTYTFDEECYFVDVNGNPIDEPLQIRSKSF